MSSDIIKQCCHKIVLDDLFEGRVETSKAALEVIYIGYKNFGRFDCVLSSVGEPGLLSPVERHIYAHQQSPQYFVEGRMGAGRIQHFCRD